MPLKKTDKSCCISTVRISGKLCFGFKNLCILTVFANLFFQNSTNLCIFTVFAISCIFTVKNLPGAKGVKRSVVHHFVVMHKHVMCTANSDGYATVIQTTKLYPTNCTVLVVHCRCAGFVACISCREPYLLWPTAGAKWLRT